MGSRASRSPSACLRSPCDDPLGTPAPGSWTVEGEFVGIDEPCARDVRDPDGGCGCGRAFFGMSSHQATTTALVRDLLLSPDDVSRALVGYDESAGCGTFSAVEVADEVEDLVRLGAAWPAGTVVERRLDLVRSRHAFT